MASKMEQIIDEIEEYIDGCKTYPLSSAKIIVNKDEIEELLSELRNKTPEEIKRYQKIISNKEAILADAQAKADAIIAQAQIKTDELIRIEVNPRQTTNVYYKYEELYKLQDALKALED